MTDISKKAVERLAQNFEGGHPAGPLNQAATTLRALSTRLAEKDSAFERLTDAYMRASENKHMWKARAEAAEARLAALRALAGEEG